MIGIVPSPPIRTSIYLSSYSNARSYLPIFVFAHLFAQAFLLNAAAYFTLLFRSWGAAPARRPLASARPGLPAHWRVAPAWPPRPRAPSSLERFYRFLRPELPRGVR